MTELTLDLPKLTLDLALDLALDLPVWPSLVLALDWSLDRP